MSAQGPTCCPKTRPSRSASYGRFATAESRQRFPFVPLAMPPRREEARTRDPADPGRCSRCAAALSRAADAPYAYRVACPRLCGRLSMPLAAISPHRRTRRRDVVIRTRQLCSKPLHGIRRSAQCAPRRPSGGIGASPGRSLLPAYACVACNFMHVRRMCVRWAQSRVGAWAAPLRFYPSAVAVVSTR